jgi:hypothetical protein
MPAKTGIQKHLKTLDSRLHGNDTERHFKTFFETIKFGVPGICFSRGRLTNIRMDTS